jgi:flagellar basal-body rod modification protein FlgD
MSDTSVNQVNGYSTSNSSSQKSKTNGSGTAVNVDTFLQLLATEMSHQDVMSPMDNTQFISQMAQFTSLQEMQNLSQTAATQYNANLTQYGSSLVGKKVNVAAYDSQGNYVEDSGIVTNCDYSSGTPAIIVNGKAYSLSSVMEVINDSNSSSFQYGASLVGKNVTVKTKDEAGKDKEVTGIVSGCNFTAGNVTVVVNGSTYELSAVTKILADSAAAAPTGNSSDTSGSTASA